MEKSRQDKKELSSLQMPLLSEDKSFPEINNSISDEQRELFLSLILSLSSIKGVGYKTLCTMYDQGYIHKMIGAKYQTSNADTKNTSDKYFDELGEMLRNIKNKKYYGQKSVEELYRKNITFIPKGHKDYPPSFYRLAQPPRWIFVNGDIGIISSDSIIGVVGTRKPTIDGQRLAYLCSSILAKNNFIVLSGLALGIDEKAHIGAVDNFGATIAVLGCGVNNLDSKMSRMLSENIINTGGTIISEYLPRDSATRETFLRRNELQVALSKLLIPIECPSLESGTGATIRRALSISTPVIGVTTNSSGINELALSSTKENLLKLGISIYKIQNGEVENFYKYLKNLFPNHNWGTDNPLRQDRFIKKIEAEVLKAQKKIAIDEGTIDRLAATLKKNIQKGG